MTMPFTSETIPEVRKYMGSEVFTLYGDDTILFDTTISGVQYTPLSKTVPSDEEWDIKISIVAYRRDV